MYRTRQRTVESAWTKGKQLVYMEVETKETVMYSAAGAVVSMVKERKRTRNGYVSNADHGREK